MTAVRVSRLLLCSAGLALAAAPSTARRACDPARHGCTLEWPTPAESDAILAEADRLLARHAGDPTSLGRRCHALGATMRARAGDVRMIPYMWREVDPDGNLAPVTGDAHLVEPGAGLGTVHIARGYDALNPDRGLPAILQTARHEFAHLAGARQRETPWGADPAAALAAACGPEAAPAGHHPAH